MDLVAVLFVHPVHELRAVKYIFVEYILCVVCTKGFYCCGVNCMSDYLLFEIGDFLYHDYFEALPSRYTVDSTTPDNIIAQNAMNLTLFHWGLHGWIVYCIVGMTLALMSHRWR